MIHAQHFPWLCTEKTNFQFFSKLPSCLSKKCVNPPLAFTASLNSLFSTSNLFFVLLGSLTCIVSVIFAVSFLLQMWLKSHELVFLNKLPNFRGVTCRCALRCNPSLQAGSVRLFYQSLLWCHLQSHSPTDIKTCQEFTKLLLPTCYHFPLQCSYSLKSFY